MVKFTETPTGEADTPVDTPVMVKESRPPASVAAPLGVHVPVSAGIGGRYIERGDGRRVKVEE